MSKCVLFFVFFVCACATGSGSLLHSCDDVCRSYTKDEVNYRFCVTSCREAIPTESDSSDWSSSDYLYPHQTYLIQDPVAEENETPELSREEHSLQYDHPLEVAQGYIDENEETPGRKRTSSNTWIRLTGDETPEQRLTGDETPEQRILFARIGKASESEARKRASSFFLIGRAPLAADGWNRGSVFRIRRSIEDNEATSDVVKQKQKKKSKFLVRNRRSNQEEADGKRAIFLGTIGKLSGDLDVTTRSRPFQQTKRGGQDNGTPQFVRFSQLPGERGTVSNSMVIVEKPLTEAREKRSSFLLGMGKLLHESKSTKKRSNSFTRSYRSPTVEGEGDGPSAVRIINEQATEDEKQVPFLLSVAKTPIDEVTKRASSFIRIGKSPVEEDEKRASSFIRIGKSPIEEEEKRASSFIRIGKSQVDENEKRASSFIRIGKSPIEEEKRASSFIRIGKVPIDEEKRASSFIRIGKSPVDADEKRASSFIRIGKVPIDEEKRQSSFIRIGKSPVDEEQKRASPFIRNVNSPIEEEKRQSSFIRIGKSPVDEEKRASSFIRIGKSPVDEDEKRASSFIRIGKSPIDKEKRPSSFIRIGKSPIDKEKRPSSFIRIGKSPGDEEKRASSFIRIGKSPSNKRISSFVRIGKTSSVGEKDALRKRLSSFVRIGKSPIDNKDKKVGGSFVKTERLAEPESNEPRMESRSHDNQHDSSFHSKLLHTTRPVSNVATVRNGKFIPPLSNPETDSELLIPVDYDKQGYPHLCDWIKKNFSNRRQFHASTALKSDLGEISLHNRRSISVARLRRSS